PKDKPWLTATLVGSESVSTNFPQFVEQVEGVDPMLLLDEVARGATSAVSLGPRIFQKVRLLKYRVSVDLARALSAAEGPGAAVSSLAIQQELTALSATSSSTGAREKSVLVWVDPSGHVMRLQAELPGSGLGTVLMT